MPVLRRCRASSVVCASLLGSMIAAPIAADAQRVEVTFGIGMQVRADARRGQEGVASGSLARTHRRMTIVCAHSRTRRATVERRAAIRRYRTYTVHTALDARIAC
jgi:hypothetical protein